jgi:hypothetical protein
VACLIDAINQANANGKANRIILRRGTYTLTAADNGLPFNANGLPVITGTLTITGQGAESTIIERGTNSPGFRIFRVEATGTLTLQKLTLRNGMASVAGGGAGISNSGTLTLIECILARNDVLSGTAGLINSGGTVSITHTTFDGNNTGGMGSGGLDNIGGTVTIANSSFVNNVGQGGGIFNGGTMTIANSTVAENGGRLDSPGGILNGGTLLLQNTTVAENTGGILEGTGGIQSGPNLLLQNTIIARNKTLRPLFTGPDCEGTIISLGNNLIGDPTGSTSPYGPPTSLGTPA